MRSVLLVSLALIGCNGDPVDDTGNTLPDDAVVFTDADADGWPADIDCDDNDPVINGGTVFYVDGDGDGFGEATTVVACEQPEGHTETPGDCDDSAANVYPGADEPDCTDPVDYNCDGSTGFADADGDGLAACEDCDDSDADVTVEREFYADADGDGFGDASSAITACAAGDGYADDATDCDDTSADVNPGATEVCNSIDDDCDAAIDLDDDSLDAESRAAWFTDADGDGFGDPSTEVSACAAPDGAVSDGSDCDDSNAAVNPGATEVCNELDDDCSGEADGADATDKPTWYIDADGDGYGTASYVLESCEQPDGYVSDASDCDDLESSAYPGNTEVCDGADNDCNGTVDGSDATDKATFYTDADGDGYGDGNSATEACSAPDGTVSQKGDCDDADASLNPETVWFIDTDGDGFGTSDGITQCSIGDGYVQEDGDCDDGADDVYPGASEVCDDLDHNCDGKVDFDADDDGGSDASCGGSDCDDSDPDLAECGLTPETALRDCKAIRDLGATSDGQYWIDPDNDGDTSNAIQVLCDMTTDGGGWTLTWAVDAVHFDGTFGNDTIVNPNAPTDYNEQQDVWNPPTELPVNQVLYGCTNNSDEKSYWRYDNETSLDFWIGTFDYRYQEPFRSDATNSDFRGGCFAAYKGTQNHGFMVIQEGDTSCGNCRDMLWGNYHYTSGGECNNTDTSLGRHPSTVDGRSIGYPLCNKKQTSTGKFWIGVR